MTLGNFIDTISMYICRDFYDLSMEGLSMETYHYIQANDNVLFNTNTALVGHTDDDTRIYGNLIDVYAVTPDFLISSFPFKGSDVAKLLTISKEEIESFDANTILDEIDSSKNLWGNIGNVIWDMKEDFKKNMKFNDYPGGRRYLFIIVK